MYENKAVLLKADNDGELWRVPCECTDSTHDVDLYFEWDNEVKLLSLDMMVYYPSNRSLLTRIKDGLSVMFGGEVKFYGNIYLDSRGARGMLNALQSGIKHAKRQKIVSEPTKLHQEN